MSIREGPHRPTTGVKTWIRHWTHRGNGASQPKLTAHGELCAEQTATNDHFAQHIALVLGGLKHVTGTIWQVRSREEENKSVK